MSEHAFEEIIDPNPQENDIAYLFSGLNHNPGPNPLPNQVPNPVPNPVPVPNPGPNPGPNPAPISYSQVLEQMDDIIRLTVISANSVFDEELFAPIEKVRETILVSQVQKIQEMEEGFNDTGKYRRKGGYERSKSSAKSVYDDAIIKILKKCADDYKYKDYFKVDQAIPIIDFLDFVISMFKDDYKFLISDFYINNNDIGPSRPLNSFARFLTLGFDSCLLQPDINTTRRIGGEPPLKRDTTYLTNIMQSGCYTIIMEIFKVIQLFVPAGGNSETQLGSMYANINNVYIIPYHSGKFNIGFIISFLQCFVDFFKNMNQLNYAFHIRSRDSSASSNKGGTRRRKQKYIKNKKGKRKTSRN